MKLVSSELLGCIYEIYYAVSQSSVNEILGAHWYI